jgi:DNA repair protein RecO (recombination protein O)
MDYGTMHRLTMSRSQRNRVLEVIIEYYRLHVPEIPEMKSVAVLHDMLT